MGTVVFCSPTITVEQFGNILARYKSPVLQEADAKTYYDIIVGYGLDPAFMLAVFIHESRAGTDPSAVVIRYGTRNWGNTRSKRAKVPGVVIQTDRGPFVKFYTWAASVHDACYRLVDPNYEYVKANARTVEEIVKIFAPGDDGNNPEGYTQFVKRLINDWKGQQTNMVNIVPKWLPVNYWAGRNGNDVEAVTIHIAEGREAGTTSWFNDRDSQVSSNYFVCFDGRILGFVREQDTAWTNGIYNKPDTKSPLIAKNVKAKINGNRWTVTIEHEGFSEKDITPAQFASSAALTRDILSRHGLPLDRDHILGHYQFDSVKKPNCPGFSSGFWDRYVATVQNGGIGIYFKETGYTLDPKFVDFFNRGGGIVSYGFPLEASHPDGDGITRQVLENVMLEYYPGSNVVRLGGLGQRFMKVR